MPTDWGSINRRIADCRRSSDPLACLIALFDETGDGFVALNAAQVSEAIGTRHALEEARRWFETAASRLPIERWKRVALDGVARVSQALPSPDGEGAPPERGTLVVVGCTKRKIWDDDPSAPLFVPARDAYTGPSLPEWVRQGRDEPSGARWLFLSAKYGFIEPDHPIGRYDVTFSQPASGPISSDSLRAQVRHQTRWGGVPLEGVREGRCARRRRVPSRRRGGVRR